MAPAVNQAQVGPTAQRCAQKAKGYAELVDGASPALPRSASRATPDEAESPRWSLWGPSSNANFVSGKASRQDVSMPRRYAPFIAARPRAHSR
jgi:hypothetical protein